MNKILLVAGLALLAGSIFLLNSNQVPSQQENTDDYAAQFATYKRTFNKKYGTNTEESYRLAVFTANTKDVEAHNAGTSSYTMGQTQFSDLTQEEFVAQYLTLRTEEFGSIQITQEDLYQDSEFVSNGPVDWRQQPGVSTHVKNQGQCGSCWAFSTVGAIEAFYATTQGRKDVDLSEQQLVDCAQNGSFGCSGGWPSNAMQWVAQNGLLTQGEYPYTARDQTCRGAGGPNRINRPQQVANDENSLRSAVEQRPVSVCVDASTWSQYQGGVLDNCGSGPINHAVLAFGYDNGFWLIKNSWGQGWGESGFIRIKDGNTCNILSYSYLAA